MVQDSSLTTITSETTVRKGVLWQQRDKVFSRWKERFFLLTPDYLQGFKKASNQMTEMGKFIFKLKLTEVNEDVVYAFHLILDHFIHH